MLRAIFRKHTLALSATCALHAARAPNYRSVSLSLSLTPPRSCIHLSHFPASRNLRRDKIRRQRSFSIGMVGGVHLGFLRWVFLLENACTRSLSTLLSITLTSLFGLRWAVNFRNTRTHGQPQKRLCYRPNFANSKKNRNETAKNFTDTIKFKSDFANKPAKRSNKKHN